jgi:hypothetical protein
MFKHDYDRIIREYFDLSDDKTRRYLISLDEAEQNKVLEALSSALYEKIVGKVDDIDFGSIPASRGDITKVEGFANTEECINIIRKLVIEYKQNPSVVDVVINAISNIKDRKAVFIKSFGMNIEFPMLMYNLVVLAIERSVSLMIATCIQYVKDPSTTTVKMALDKAAYLKTMDDTLYKQLITFNDICHDGSFDKMVDNVMSKSSIREDADVYGAVAPIDEEPGENNDVPVNSDTSELFDAKPEEVYPSEEAPKADDTTVSDYDNFDNTPATEPAANADTEEPTNNPEEFPETHFDDNNRPIDPDQEVIPIDIEEDDDPNTEVDMADADVQFVSPDVPTSVPQTSEVPVNTDNNDVSPTADNDTVEPQNIPQVTPSDAGISTADKAISEDEITNEGVGSALKGVTNIANKLGDKKTIIGVIGLAVAGLGLIVKGKDIFRFIVGLLRNLVYGFYYSKMKVADYLEVQADLIEANANELEISTTSGLDEESKNRAVKKQRDWAMKLRKWSDKFNIDSKNSAKETEKAKKEDEKDKKKIDKNDEGDDVLF